MSLVNGAYDQSGWTATADSNESGFSPGEALRGHWDQVSGWISGSGAFPHYIIVDMKAAKTFANIFITTTISWGTVGFDPIGWQAYEVYVSTDGSTWGSSIASGTLASPQGQFFITFSSQTKRYLKIVAVSASAVAVPGGGSYSNRAALLNLFVAAGYVTETSMASQKYTTLGAGLLNSSYTAGATSIVLQSGQGASFPSAGDFVVAIGSPPSFFLKATARSSDTLTVETTAVDGTSASSVASGTAVTEVVTATVLNGIRSDMHTSGVLASAPSAVEAHKGDLYLSTDAPLLLRYNGSAWVPYGPVHAFTPPVLSSFTVGTVNTATTTDTGYGISITGSANQGVDLYKSGPGSTPFTVTMAFLGVLGGEGFPQIVMVGRESSSGKLINFGVQHPSSGSISFIVNKLNSGGSFNAQYITKPVTEWCFGGGLVYLRIRDNGTNRICEISADGVLFQTFHSIGRTDFCTCNQFGFSVQGSTNYLPCARILHWEQLP